MASNSSHSDSEEYDSDHSDDSLTDLTEMLRVQEREFITQSEPKVSQEALDILLKIPNVSKQDILSWLYMARVLSTNEEMFDYICTYITNSQDHEFGIKVNNIVRLVRKDHKEFEHIPKLKNRFRMLLWHGTKSQYVSAILKDGFQIPSAKRQMFGTGIYFADRASKSANYCRNTRQDKTGYMFLCDVLLGLMYNAKQPKNEYKTAPIVKDEVRGTQKTFDSVKCTGKNIPDKNEQVEVNRCIIPCGKTVTNLAFSSYTVLYNEFIVYDPENVRLKYLVEFEFVPKNS